MKLFSPILCLVLAQAALAQQPAATPKKDPFADFGHTGLDGHKGGLQPSSTPASSFPSSSASSGNNSAAASATGPANGIVVVHSWNGGGALEAIVQSVEVADLGALFGGSAKAAEDLAPHPGLTIYPGITYLMPRTQAETKLPITSPGYRARSQIDCSGFPKGLTVFAYDAHIDIFDRVCLVADQADQVVAVELVAQNAFRPPPAPGNREWHTIDYPNQEVKGTPRARVLSQYPVKYNGFDTAWTASFYQPANLRRTTAWFVPQPLIGLILLCVQHAQKHGM